MLKEPTIRIRWLKPEEAGRLFEELPFHLEMMCRFSLATGLRKANVVGLEWSQIDLNRRVAWIHPDQAKKEKAIGLPLNNEAILVLRQLVGKHKEFVFTYNSKPVNQTNTKAWRKALIRADITNFRWHDLRHTWASWHTQNGTPIEVLKELGGWADIRMVQKYAHIAPEHLARHASNISGLKTASGTFLATPNFAAGTKKA